MLLLLGIGLGMLLHRSLADVCWTKTRDVASTISCETHRVPLRAIPGNVLLRDTPTDYLCGNIALRLNTQCGNVSAREVATGGQEPRCGISFWHAASGCSAFVYVGGSLLSEDSELEVVSVSYQSVYLKLRSRSHIDGTNRWVLRADRPFRCPSTQASE